MSGQQNAIAVELSPNSSAAPSAAPPAETKNAVSESSTPPPRGSWRPIAGWSAVGLGVASFASGLYFQSQALEKIDDGDALPPGQRDATDQLNDDIETAESFMLVSYGVGALLVGAGVTLLLWPDEQEQTTASIGIGPQRIVLGVTW